MTVGVSWCALAVAGFLELFGSKSAAFKVFAFFCRHPRASLHSIDAARKAGLSYGASFKALRSLEKFGFLEKSAVGRTIAYSLRDCAETRAFKVFLNAVEAKRLLGDFFKDGVERVVLYGSKSLGTDLEESDFDVVVIAFEKNLFAGVPGRLASGTPKVSVSLFTPLEWERVKRSDPVFYENVSRGLVLWERRS